jgi:hypothetical protein
VDSLAAESFLNADHRIFGRRMLPLSLGHAFALEAVGNPFYHGKLGTSDELRLAAWMCSRPPLSLPETSGWRHRLWRWGTDKADFNAEVAAWRAYVADYVAPPQLWNKAPKAGERRHEPSKIPSNLLTVVRLMRMGMTEQQAWATSVGVAAWYEAAWYESEGGQLDIVTDAERMAILRSKLKKQGGKNGRG